MSDPTSRPERTSPNYDLYQREIFKDGSYGTLPSFSTDPDQLEAVAASKLSERGRLYALSNAGLSLTARTNRAAFAAYQIIPRMLRPTLERDISTTLFGHHIPAPIGFAPVGVNEIYNPEGELAVASVAGELGLPYCLSTASSRSVERVAEANDAGAKAAGRAEGGPRFFQLYLPHNWELAESLLKRAWDNGFDVCIMTLDTDHLAWRHGDVAQANYTFYYGQGNEMGWTDPVFHKYLEEKGIDPKKDPKTAGRAWIDTVWHGKAHSWDDLPRVIKLWKDISGGKPFVLKGIQCVEDALLANRNGCDGIIVSNHAGRQVDGAVASLEMLPEIVDAVGGDMTVMFDSGVRTGADVFKALALGAKAVFIGRLWIYGLAIQGAPGVRHVTKSLLADFDSLMDLAGYRSLGEVSRAALKIRDIARL
ncbi:FMN-dependent alpha-hydroxy acid dehydrogenase [Dacryopinax primogenitus]|uniref:FMN-dependent alpha-hydroxy acid dehydrogenase n=1 Tax=Dacryopinax primogenitus (strain DJM 731) TaxID=1858805 RepID=M5FXU7_DACPD|nr:FMN-dependent alpha-hydroxy acid dehydrogenase [Dacryopinax primogenitus]EJU02866.1 FMN-dependent alpha-hydroxy acid dehydrogenase [Dacryopinax primogenitus]